MPSEPYGPEVPRQAPHERGAQLVDWIEDAGFLALLFSGVAIVVMIALLLIVL